MWDFFLCPSKALSATEYLPSPVKQLKRKASGMTCWINTRLSILSMQIEIEVLHLPLDFRKSSVKDMVHAPIPPRYPLPLKGWQLHHSESKIWSQYLAAQRYFFFSHWAAEIRDPTDITEFTLFPLLPVLPLLLSSEGSEWPPNTPATLCCYFQYKISIQGLLDASQCLFSTPPTRFSLNARQIEHFRNWHFSRSVCQCHAPC